MYSCESFNRCHCLIHFYIDTQSTEIIFEPPSCKNLNKICEKQIVLSHRLINAFGLLYIHTIMSIVVVLSRNIKYLASSQQGFSCDKALSTLYDPKNPFITLFNPLYSGNPE